ncbi:MoaD/ThiS family protein [Sphingomonas sp. HDW15A]|uniref:MoaD/ThiS family protein n=1 Tax=Sphingomonas sp. HDW15A TaxID=2714942 RepID=UPI0014084BBA|nr:MoaD/ThiS family protein [Sphingomonas sp. HDW15A]QIK95778.1 MoaD/ThiS family protein [Sphingomonas sp. HDW15A]
MKVRFYGKLGEVLGEQLEFKPPPGTQTISDLRATLAELYPEASADLGGRTMACVEDAIVNDETRITDADVVEFLPPLSGG